MDVTYLIGDATTPAADGPAVIVHVCNDVGGWGKGFVLALSRRYPEPERRYRAWHQGEDAGAPPFALGQVQFVPVKEGLWVANLVGQHGLGRRGRKPPVRYDAIGEGLRRVAAFARAQGASVHMPRIGCGLAGGKWEAVEPLLKKELLDAGVPVSVYDQPAEA